jgi:hypothetical protein
MYIDSYIVLIIVVLSWLWFQAINKVILKLFRNKKSILAETLKWIIFLSSIYIPLFGKEIWEAPLEILGTLVLCTTIARIISLLIKKLILFIAKKIKKENKVEIIAEVISWGVFALAILALIFLLSISIVFNQPGWWF